MFPQNKLVFIFSLPRSGSTLLQRSLAAQSGFTSAPETWVLVKLLGALSGISEYSEYGSMWANRGVSEFFEDERLGNTAAREALTTAYLNMLGEVCDEKPNAYFIEKTPRNSLVVQQIIELFPDSKFIFLWRHPAAVIHSMNETWSQGHWHFRSDIDLELGLTRLMEARASLGTRALSVNYECLVDDYQRTMRTILEFVGESSSDVEYPIVALGPRSATMGDKSGLEKYGSAVVKDESWTSGYQNSFRRFCLRSYLRRFDLQQWEDIGYSEQDLEQAFKSKRIIDRYLVADFFRQIYANLVFKTGIEIVARRIFSGRAGRRYGIY